MNGIIKIISFGLLICSQSGLRAAAEPFITTPSGFNEPRELQPHQSAAAYWSGAMPKSVVLEVDASGGSLVLSQDQKLLIFYGSNSIKVLDLNSGMLIRTFQLATGYGASFSTGSKRLLTYNHDGVIKIWNAETGELISKLTCPFAQHFHFSRDGNVFAFETQDGTIEVYALQTGEETYALLRQRTAQKNVIGLAFIDERMLAIFKANNHFRISLWNVIDNKVSQRFKFQKQGQSFFLWFSQYPHAMRVEYTPQKFIIRTETGQTISEMRRITTAEPLCVEVSEDRTLLAIAFSDGAIGLWNIQTGRLIQRLTGHVSKITELDCSEDGRIIVSCTDRGAIRIWRVGE